MIFLCIFIENFNYLDFHQQMKPLWQNGFFGSLAVG